MAKKRRFRCWWLILLVPCVAYLHILLLWLTFTNIFPTTILLTFAYEDAHGSVRTEDLIGSYVARWPDSGSTDTLQLLADGRLLQRVVFDDGRVEDHQGTWDYDQATGDLVLTGRLDLYDKDETTVNGPEDLGNAVWLIVPKNRIEIGIGDAGTRAGLQWSQALRGSGSPGACSTCCALSWAKRTRCL